MVRSQGVPILRVNLIFECDLTWYCLQYIELKEYTSRGEHSMNTPPEEITDLRVFASLLKDYT